MNKLLITTDIIKEYRPMATEIPMQRIQPFILETQLHDLRPIFGDSLYFDFMSKYDVIADPMYTAYQELLNGKSYTYNGVVYEYPGLYGMLSYFTLARFFSNNDINITRYGLVLKVDKEGNSERADVARINAAISDLRSNAISFQGMVKDFLGRNVATYTKYSTAEDTGKNTTGVQLFDC